MRLLTCSLLVFVLWPSVAQGQNNSCSGPEPTGNIETYPKELSTIFPEFATTNPNGQPIVTSLNVEVRNGATVVQSFTLPRTAMIAQSGIPANCYKFALPAVTNPVQPNVAHVVALQGNFGPTPGPFRVSSNGFFIPGAPTAPASLRLAILNTLSKLWDSVLSTRYTKPWFQPVGR